MTTYRASLGTRGELRRIAAEAELATIERVRPWHRKLQACRLAPHVIVPQWIRSEHKITPEEERKAQEAETESIVTEIIDSVLEDVCRERRGGSGSSRTPARRVTRDRGEPSTRSSRSRGRGRGRGRGRARGRGRGRTRARLLVVENEDGDEDDSSADELPANAKQKEAEKDEDAANDANPAQGTGVETRNGAANRPAATEQNNEHDAETNAEAGEQNESGQQAAAAANTELAVAGDASANMPAQSQAGTLQEGGALSTAHQDAPETVGEKDASENNGDEAGDDDIEDDEEDDGDADDGDVAMDVDGGADGDEEKDEDYQVEGDDDAEMDSVAED